MIEKSPFRQSKIDQAFLIDLKSKTIHVQLNRVFLILGLCPERLLEIINAWSNHIQRVSSPEQAEEHLYLPMLMLPEFIDSIPAQLLSPESQAAADEYKQLIRSIHCSALILKTARKAGIKLPAPDLHSRVSAQVIQDVSMFIAAQPSKRTRSYRPSYANYTFTINNQPVH
jgi:hypothetical protein